MFQDEAGFGRISSPSSCWAPPKERPCTPYQIVRQYRNVYGAVCPTTGESHFEVHGKNNGENFQLFLNGLSEKFPHYYIVLCCDNASWHKNKEIKIPRNIKICFLPPRTPEMNPIEQIWKEIRKRGFKNVIFDSIDAVINKFWDVVDNLEKSVIMSITLREWIKDLF
jgi:putative transposase